MDFFERSKALAKKQAQKYAIAQGAANRFWLVGFLAGIDAHAEALKGMKLGQPKLARISHHIKPDGEEWTSVRCFDGEQISLDGHCGTDGEEVYVTVFRRLQ